MDTHTGWQDDAVPVRSNGGRSLSHFPGGDDSRRRLPRPMRVLKRSHYSHGAKPADVELIGARAHRK